MSETNVAEVSCLHFDSHFLKSQEAKIHLGGGRALVNPCARLILPFS